MTPWGGFGANPEPAHLQGLWKEWGPRVVGGFPYSEGIYEDINKAIVSQFYWSDRPAEETIREYVAYEYAPSAVEPVLKAIRLLETNQERSWKGGDFLLPRKSLAMSKDHGAAKARKLLEQAESGLPPAVRSGWPWRVLMLRGLIDDALFAADGGHGFVVRGADPALPRGKRRALRPPAHPRPAVSRRRNQRAAVGSHICIASRGKAVPL